MNPARTQSGSAFNLAVNKPITASSVRKITFRAWPTARAVRYELFNALDLPGVPPRRPGEFDGLLKTALAERPRVFLVDEAQWLKGEVFECFRYLWGEPSTRLAIILVGGEGCYTVLCREPMLSSRIFIWQHVTRLTPDEDSRTIPLFHPVGADAGPEDIAFADRHAARGNFPDWARLTARVRLARAHRPAAGGPGGVAVGVQPAGAAGPDAPPHAARRCLQLLAGVRKYR
ncbi:AAA family ATPase [Streptomyces sp. NPDC091406]|uniref:AAA family ATPase n=1 Tax=unclassified Streptomyces TaxID=2593676 RepID=UPI0037FC4037